MRLRCHPPLAGENTIHHKPMPACAGSGLKPFRIQLRRDAIKAQPGGPQRPHTLDYGLFAVVEAVGLTAFATAFFGPLGAARFVPFSTALFGNGLALSRLYSCG